jgi:hypothetical protein
MFSPSAQAAAQPSAPPAAAGMSAPVARKANYLPLILVGVGFLIVLIVLVAFFVLHK